ncbi:hypothetical protein FRC01_006986, partial [Tulasnella sp. 417]
MTKAKLPSTLTSRPTLEMPGPVFSLRNRSNSYEAPTQCLSSRTIEVEDDICSLSETLSRVSFYPSPDPLSENEQEAPVTSSLPEPSDDLGLYGRPDSASSGLSIVSRRAFTFEDIDPTPSYDLRTSIDSPAVASTQDEEECDVDDWSSESEGSGDDIDGAFTIVSLEEVAFPSLNSSPYANMVPGYFQYYAEEERGRPDSRGHHRYHAEDDYTQPSASEHYAQRGDSFAHFQRGFLPTWSRSIS